MKRAENSLLLFKCRSHIQIVIIVVIGVILLVMGDVVVVVVAVVVVVVVVVVVADVAHIHAGVGRRSVIACACHRDIESVCTAVHC